MHDDKFVDESWKDAVESEKTKEPVASQSPVDNQSNPQASDPDDFSGLDFFSYISSLAFQAMIFLGDMPHPLTNQTEKNLKQARFLIDTLGLLKEKTVGNLTQEENELLTNSLYQLQLRYVELAGKEGKPTT